MLACIGALAIPAGASAAVYQYGCCSTSNGVTLSTTDGWKVRSSNSRNTPSGQWYCLDRWDYNGTPSGSNVFGRCTSSGTDSISAGPNSSRQTCRNSSGSFLINVSCWTIQ